MAKFITKRAAYIGGEYVFADLEHPAVIELPDDAKPAPHLIPYGGGEVKGDKLQPAFNPRGQGHAIPKAAEVAKGGKGKRASDDDAI